MGSFNASEPLYLGVTTQAHARVELGAGQTTDVWEQFNHGLGYVLSSAALIAARNSLLACAKFMALYYLDSKEDMTLGACLTLASVYPRELGPMLYDFDGDVDRVASAPQKPLIVHPVEPEAMYRLDAVMQSR